MRNFRSLRPGNIQTLLKEKALAEQNGIILAGGTNVSNYIKQGKLSTGVLMDISGISELKGVTEEGEFLRIGACTTIGELIDSELVKTRNPFFQESLWKFANPLIRNLATIGGNIADASPAADSAPLLLASDALVIAEKEGGKREIPINEFFDRPRKTFLESSEVITGILLPFQKNKVGIFLKMGERNSSAISISSVAVLLSKEGNKITDIRIALGSVAPKPLRCERTEKEFAGQTVTEETIFLTAQTVKDEIAPIKDVRGSAEWRKELTANLTARAVRICFGMEE